MWAVYAFWASLATGMYYLGNQAAKIPPTIFMLYRGAVPALLLLPFVLFFAPVESPYFYAVCLVQGGVISFIDRRNFRPMRTFGAETVSAIHPFSVGLVFVLWLFFNPAQAAELWHKPFRFLAVTAALSVVIYSVSGYRRSRRSRRALIYMLPYLLFCALCDVLNKTAMSFLAPDEMVRGSYYYILLTALVISVINLSFYFGAGGKTDMLFSLRNIKYASLMPVLVLSMICKNFAMFAAPNPSYVTAALYLYIVWVFVAGAVLRLCGRKTIGGNISFRQALLLTTAVAVLVLFGR